MGKVSKAAALLFSDPGVLLRKVENEFRAPSNGITGALRKLYCLFRPLRTPTLQDDPDRFLLVYDTAVNPVTFDFVHYLYYANWQRIHSGKTHLDLLLVVRPNPAAALVRSYREAIGDDNVTWRLTNLLIPLFRLFPAADRLYMVDEKQAFALASGYRHIHPQGYSYASPRSALARLDEPGLAHVGVLQIPDTARAIVAAYLPESDLRKIVTVTLRSYDYISVRNSNIAAWVDFARSLDSTSYKVVFVPDASMHGVKTFPELEGFAIFDAACWNIGLRTALYARAWINMGVACGPLVLSGLMEHTRTVMIDRSLDYPKTYLDGILSSTGVTPGVRPSFYSASCHFHLGRDDTQTILGLFNAHVR